MSSPSFTTGYARLGRLEAQAILFIAAALTAWAVSLTVSPWKMGFADSAFRGPGDGELYRAEVERIRQGDTYYQAASQELRSRGYPTGSVFNWRAPLPVWLLGQLPNPTFGKALLGVIALAALIAGFSAADRESGLATANVGAVAMIGALMPCILGELYVFPVLWCGTLIALSVGLYGVDRRWQAPAAGVAALFCRELALPYCLVAIVLTARERRWTEIYWWCFGLGCYAIYYLVHVQNVLSLIGPGDRTHAESWLQYGGLPFVISTCQMNAFLLLLPQWVTALFLTAALVGLAGWNTPTGTLVGCTVAIYLAALSLLGHDFNQYWGVVFAPLLCFGAARFPASIRDLLDATGSSAAEPAR